MIVDRQSYRDMPIRGAAMHKFLWKNREIYQVTRGLNPAPPIGHSDPVLSHLSHRGRLYII